MKRIKIILISAAILLGVGGAWATRPCLQCTLSQQYYFNGFTYMAVNGYGSNYYCWDYPDICTYYKPNPFTQPNYYAPCREGQFAFLE